MNPNSTNAAAASGALILTPMDVQRLLVDDSPDSRAHVLEKIASGYNTGGLHGREREIAEQVFRLLMKDVALRVRETLAERLRHSEIVPRDIMLHLAGDVESVATPVLGSSPVLSDSDLVGIVEKSHEIGKLVAIAKRELISPRVSEALVETRYAPVMTSLLANRGATISERSLEKIAEDFRGDTAMAGLLAQIPRLPITVVERILTQVSDAVAQDLRTTYNISAADARQGTGKVREDVMLRLIGEDLSQHEMVGLVAQMAAEDRLTPSIVVTSLCRGQLEFFTIAMAHFSSISVANTARLIADRGEHGFNGLYKKSGLPDSMMDAVRLLLRAVQDMVGDSSVPGSMLYANRLTERVIVAAGSQQIEYLPYFIALIRQNQQRG